MVPNCITNVLLGFAITANISFAAGIGTSCRIESPVDASTVNAREIVVIQTTERRKPIVAVRLFEQGSPWHVQDAGVLSGRNRYDVPVTFGDGNIEPGSCFQVTLLNARDYTSAAKLRPGASWQDLPDGISYGHVITVFVGENDAPKEEQPAEIAAQLVSPVSGAYAARVQNVAWQLKVPSLHRPRLLVRADEENSNWWVQEPLSRSSDGRRLSGTAVIGNAHTESGTEFLLMLVRPKHTDASEIIRTGDVLTDLSGYQCSPPFTLISR